MIKLNQGPGEYTLRASHHGANQLITGFATMRYGESRTTVQASPAFNQGGMATSSGVILLDDLKIRPFDNIPPSMDVSQTHILQVARYGAPWIWKLDDLSYPQIPAEYAEETPLLYYPSSVEARNDSLVIRTLNGTWIDIVFVITDSGSPAHPMHKHSNKAYVIGSGVYWNWTTVAEAAATEPESFNFENPPFRDGFTTQPVDDTPTWLAIRYEVVNPGAFLMHCHIQPHLSGGMALALMDGVDAFPEIPGEYRIDGNGMSAQ